jgi:hypothetical protein
MNNGRFAKEEHQNPATLTMPNIYFDGIDPKLAPICEMFGALCNENSINYSIKTDEIQFQEYQVRLRPKLVDLLKAAAAPEGIIVSYNDETLSIKPHKLAESRRTEYNINQLDPAGLERMQNWAIQYIGEKNRGPFSDLFRGMVLPVRIADVQSVWQSHLKDPRWDELGNEKSAYVDKPGDYPPIVIDTVEEHQDYPHGRLVDGYKRLFAANHHQEPLIEYVDMNDLVTEANQHFLNEDQYKSPTRRMIYRQSAFRSSFGPTRSFGGVTGYSRVRRKRKASECDMNEYGKLTGDLTAHDQKTVIPKGSVVKVVDADEGLPDVEWEGKIINVDREALEKVWKPTSFSEQIERALESHDDSKPRVEDESEFENQLNEAFGGISIVEPDVLFTLNQKLDGKGIEEETPKDK